MHIRSISFHLFINYLCRCPKVHGPQDTGLLRALHSRNPKNIRNPLIFLQKWLLTHVFGGSQVDKYSCKQAYVGFPTF